MAISTQRLAKNIRFWKGTVLIGCADGGDETVTIQEIPTKCVGSNGIETIEPGDVKYDLSVKGIYKQYTSSDAAANISVDQLWDDAVAGTEVTMIVGGAASGDQITTYVGYFLSVKKSHAIGSVSTYDATFRANSCVKSTRP